MASKIKNLNSPNQSGISTYFIKNSNTTTPPPSNKQKTLLNSPELETPPVKEANMSDKLPPDLKLLYDSLSQKWDERMDPLESKVNALFSEESNLPRHIEYVNEMKHSQGKLESRLNIIEKENTKLKQKLTLIEDQMLENCVVLTGLNEDKWEDPIPRRNLIDKELASILPGEDDEEKLTKAKPVITKPCPVTCPEDDITLSHYPWKSKLEVHLKRLSEIESDIWCNHVVDYYKFTPTPEVTPVISDVKGYGLHKRPIKEEFPLEDQSQSDTIATDELIDQAKALINTAKNIRYETSQKETWFQKWFLTIVNQQNTTKRQRSGYSARTNDA